MMRLSCRVCVLIFFGITPALESHPDSFFVLDTETFRHHVDTFNSMEKENVVNHIPNAQAWTWMVGNVPFFECPDEAFNRIYYYRWWTYRKHIKKTPDGFILTEFLTPVGHATKYNAISCAYGHHVYEGRWLHDRRYIDEYTWFWFRKGKNGGPQKRFHQFSGWPAYALYQRLLVNQDREFVVDLLDDLVRDYRQWETERLLPSGLFWQFDVRDGMEESISGSRRAKNARPTINSYMYGNAKAIAAIAELAGENELAKVFTEKAATLKSLVQKLLWDSEAKFFKARLERSDSLADVREELGYIPWYFNLPDEGYDEAWAEILDPRGFLAPYGLTTAERRHPNFRTHGTGTCEWDGAVWPFATTQTLVGLANLLNHYSQSVVTKKDYFNTLRTYVKSHQKEGKPFIGEYLDEKTGEWLKDKERSRYYNHSGFCDLVITGLVGLRPQSNDRVVVNPLIPSGIWDSFCLDRVLYHGRMLTILWDRDGKTYGKGKGLRVFAGGQEIAHSGELDQVSGRLPERTKER